MPDPPFVMTRNYRPRIMRKDLRVLLRSDPDSKTLTSSGLNWDARRMRVSVAPLFALLAPPCLCSVQTHCPRWGGTPSPPLSPSSFIGMDEYRKKSIAGPASSRQSQILRRRRRRRRRRSGIYDPFFAFPHCPDCPHPLPGDFAIRLAILYRG